MKQVLRFSYTAEWVIEKLRECVYKQTKAQISVRYKRGTNCGEVHVEASNQADLDQAVHYITTCFGYRSHFTIIDNTPVFKPAPPTVVPSGCATSVEVLRALNAHGNQLNSSLPSSEAVISWGGLKK